MTATASQQGPLSDGEIIRELVMTMTRAIVDVGDAVECHVLQTSSTIVIELSVAREDVGKVIGRRGAMADAFRTIISNAATKLKKRVVLQILE